MKTAAIATIAALAATAQATVQGFDVSSYQPNVNMKSAKAGGAHFVIIKVFIYALQYIASSIVIHGVVSSHLILMLTFLSLPQ